MFSYFSGRVSGRVAALSVAAVLSALVAPSVVAEKVSSAVGKPFMEAQKLIQSGNTDAGLQALGRARAAAKTQYEKFQVNEMYVFAYSKQRNYGAAADANEAALNMGAGNRSQRLNTICQMRYQARQMDKAIAACGRVAKENPTGATWGLLASMYRQQRQYAASNNAVQAALRSGGGGSTENLLQMQFDNYTQLRDSGGQRRTLEQMVAMKPSRENWVRLQTVVESKLPSKPRMDLDMERLRLVTGVSDKADQFMLLAQLALEAGLPGEAVTVLAKGVSAKVLGAPGPGKERQDRLIAKAKTDAAADQAALPAADKEAQAAPDGKKGLLVGQRYVSYGRYNEGIAAIKRAISKGGIDAGEAQLRLGQAYYAAGRRAEAQKAFSSVSASNPYSAVANLLSIHTRASS